MTLKWKGMLTWFQILWVSVRSQKNPFKHKILVVDMFFRCKSRRFSRACLLILQSMWKLTIFIRISTETVIPHPRDLKLTFYPSSLLFLSVQTSCPSSGPRLTPLCLGQGPAGIWPSMLSSNSKFSCRTPAAAGLPRLIINCLGLSGTHCPLIPWIINPSLFHNSPPFFLDTVFILWHHRFVF